MSPDQKNVLQVIINQRKFDKNVPSFVVGTVPADGATVSSHLPTEQV